ncbi:hypothetical protein RvY_09410 [Ramazzottius varieornatus]|uniref:Uncharacterized protein n=1 Tax=Ramazzottius varieornatus TaxID=947166 RepID=A0A1D1VBP2_RAMVA|nr:hypothetical protein RvY_09410 [Ramazzottius varieornatus]
MSMNPLSIFRHGNASRYRPEIKIIEGGDNTIVPNEEDPAVTNLTNKEAGGTSRTSSNDSRLLTLLYKSGSLVPDHAESQTGEVAIRTVSTPSCPRMTKEALVKVCKELKLYTTPSLNDVLYLNHRGYPRIENLEAYTGLRCLFLGSNGLQKIENLDHQIELRSLFLQQNLISKIENLDKLAKLANLSLTGNRIHRIENLASLLELRSVELSHNSLSSLEDVSHLANCQSIEILDLSHNKLGDPAIIDVFAQMGNLGVLCLTANPVISKIPNYRKTIICKIKTLNHLDQCPVFPRDRACAEAWYTGGREAEMNERQAWMDKHQKDIKDSLRHLSELRQSAQTAKDTVEMIVQTVLKQEKLADAETTQSLMETYEEVRLSPSFNALSVSANPTPLCVPADMELGESDRLNITEISAGEMYLNMEAERSFPARPTKNQDDNLDYSGNQMTYQEGVFGHDRRGCAGDLESVPDTFTSSLLINRDGFESVSSSKSPFGLASHPVYPIQRKPLIELLPDEP